MIIAPHTYVKLGDISLHFERDVYVINQYIDKT